MNEPYRGRYPIGSIVLRTEGYSYVKRMDGTWESEHRINAARHMGRDLLEGERVFHKNGKRQDNTPANLAVIRFNLEKFKRLPHSRVIYLPTRRSNRDLIAA